MVFATLFSTVISIILLILCCKLFQTPIQTMSGHTEGVSSIQWTSSTDIISGGWDHCIRLWDVLTGVNKDTLVR